MAVRLLRDAPRQPRSAETRTAGRSTLDVAAGKREASERVVVLMWKKPDWRLAGAWALILLLVIAFWAGVGFGVAKALGALRQDKQPVCVYSPAEMHERSGTSSAYCTLEP